MEEEKLKLDETLKNCKEQEEGLKKEVRKFED